MRQPVRSELQIDTIRVRKILLLDDDGKTVGGIIGTSPETGAPAFRLEAHGRSLTALLSAAGALFGVAVNGQPAALLGVDESGKPVMLPDLPEQVRAMDAVLREIVRGLGIDVDAQGEKEARP